MVHRCSHATRQAADGLRYWAGKIYLAGGYTDGFINTAQSIMHVYDVLTNTWDTTRASMPATLGGAGGAAVNGEFFVMGGRDAVIANRNIVYVYNIAANMWAIGANIPTGVNVPGSAVIGGNIWLFGGGNPFAGPRTSPEFGRKGVQVPDTTNILQIYDPATNIWSSGPPLSQQRSFPAGTNVGNTAVAVGGYTGTTSTNSVEINVGTGCPTPTPTVTPTATPTPTPGPCNFQVLIVYSDTGQPTQFQSQILAEPGVTAVDLFDGQVGTPTLAQLQQYDIVVPYSNFVFFDAVTLGNNLADYVDGGGIVVQYGFSHFGPTQIWGIYGRWLNDNYNPYAYSESLLFGAFTLGTFNAGHPLMAGVTTLNSDFQNVVTPAAGATEIAAASNGNSLVAFRPVSGGHTTVGVTAYVGTDSTQSGHWGRVVVNAGNWLGCGAEHQRRRNAPELHADRGQSKLTAGNPTMAGRMFDGIPDLCGAQGCPGPLTRPRTITIRIRSPIRLARPRSTVTTDAMTCVGTNFIFVKLTWEL